MKDFLCVNHHLLLAITLLSMKNINFYILVTSNYYIFIFQNLIIAGLLGEKFDFQHSKNI